MNLFDGCLKVEGYLAKGGQIIDAIIVLAPRQCNLRDENVTVNVGKIPEERGERLAKYWRHRW